MQQPRDPRLEYPKKTEIEFMTGAKIYKLKVGGSRRASIPAVHHLLIANKQEKFLAGYCDLSKTRLIGIV